MSDLIDREQAISALAVLGDKMTKHGQIVIEQAIVMLRDLYPAECDHKIVIRQRSGKALESAINYLRNVGWLQEHDRELTEPRWIPVTERLPENESIVVCTVKGYESERLVITDCRYKDGIWEYLDEPSYDYWILLEGVIAWMPLPEPWRGE